MSDNDIREQMSRLERAMGRVEGGQEEIRRMIEDRGTRMDRIEKELRDVREHQQRTDGARDHAGAWSKIATPIVSAIVGALTGAFAAVRMH